MQPLGKISRTTLLACAVALGATVSSFSACAQQADAASENSGRIVADRLASLMEERYVYPEIGKRYAGNLRANAASGQYDALTGKHLADQLLADLKAVNPDGHLNVIPDPQPGSGPSPAADTSPLAHVGKDVPNIEFGRWLAPGIAFIRYNLFPSQKAEIEATARFLDEHAEARVVIFDVRTHRGGAVGEIDEIFSRLVTEPTRLLTMATRRSLVEIIGMPPADNPRMRLVTGDPEFVSLEHWALPAGTKPPLKARIYLLTSNRTSSAAEHFALALKVTGRGTLVGAQTDGANHFGGLEPVAEGISAFIPVGRTFDPATGKDWEEAGVTPDIATEPEEALVRVLELEGLDAANAKALSDEVAPDRPMRWTRR